MQICRRAYTVHDKDSDIELDIENQYIMSPKDLKTIHFMNKMMDAGVRVFKIEGRARGPEYVRIVTECYKEAVRAYCEGTFTEEKVAGWDERLRMVFNRGFWNGYYLGQRLGEWSSKYGSGATRKKVYVQKVDEIRVDRQAVPQTVKGERFSIKVNEKVRPSDRLYVMEIVEPKKEFK